MNLHRKARRDGTRRNRRRGNRLRSWLRRVRVSLLLLLQNRNGRAVERRHKRRIRVDRHNQIVCRNGSSVNCADNRAAFDSRRARTIVSLSVDARCTADKQNHRRQKSRCSELFQPIENHRIFTVLVCLLDNSHEELIKAVGCRRFPHARLRTFRVRSKTRPKPS